MSRPPSPLPIADHAHMWICENFQAEMIANRGAPGRSAALGLSESSGRQLGEQADRQADDVGDAALEALDQSRAQGLDRVAAQSAPATRRNRRSGPLVPRRLPEDDRRCARGPLRSSPSRTTTRPLSTSCERPDIRSRYSRASAASAGLPSASPSRTTSVSQAITRPSRSTAARLAAARSRPPEPPGPRRSAPRPRGPPPRTLPSFPELSARGSHTPLPLEEIPDAS